MKIPDFAQLALALPFVLAGCKQDSAVKPSESNTGLKDSYDAPPAPSTTGKVVGTVRLTGIPPVRVPIDMSQDPACSLSGSANLSEQVIVNRGGLANVFLYVKGAPRLMPAKQPVVIDQKGCRFVPHVVAVAAGGTVEFLNSDPTMHNVHSMAMQAGNKSIDLSQGPGAKPQDVRFTEPENMVPVRCNNHPWMNAFVNVSPNTFFAISNQNGEFSLPGLPEGNYTMVFVHEKLGQRSMEFSVKAGKETNINLDFAKH